MRKISVQGILGFAGLVLPALGASLLLAKMFFSAHLISAFNEAATVAVFVLSLYTILIVEYRLLFQFFPITYGPVEAKSRDELIYFIHALYTILFFQPILQMHILPTPFLTLFYRLLGVKMGTNTYVTGVLIDYTMIEIGSNTLLGLNATAYCHALEGERLSHFPVKIGSGVTIGAQSIILPGVTIEDDAVVAAGSVVKKGTLIRKGEIWGGVPARFLKSKYEKDTSVTQFDSEIDHEEDHVHKIIYA